MYTWGYIKNSALSKLDLEEPTGFQSDSFVTSLLNRFTYYANEVITQVCSSIKPKLSFVDITVELTELVGGAVIKTVDAPDFISFGTGVNTVRYVVDGKTYFEECHDDDFVYKGYNQIMFFKEGTYTISYNARWYTFDLSITNDEIINIPTDILEAIPSYIASQCMKIDDEYKAQVFRNEYEMMLARIDDTDYSGTKTFKIGGGW